MKNIRQWVGRVVPKPVVQQLKKWYYPGVLRRFSESDWPGCVVVKNLVEPGDTVIDAGANIGYVSMLLASWVGSAGRVCSFEPVPDTFSILKSNVRRLGLKQVSPLPFAVSSGSGSATMAIPRYDSGYENFYEARVLPVGDAGSGLRIQPVDLRRLDDIVQPDWPVSFIKVDVEGHELDAIRGGLQTIRRVKPSLMIEVNGNPNEQGSPSCELFQLLRNEAYSAYWWDGSRLRARSMDDQRVDYFFLTAAHAKKLDARGVRL